MICSLKFLSIAPFPDPTYTIYTSFGSIWMFFIYFYFCPQTVVHNNLVIIAWYLDFFFYQIWNTYVLNVGTADTVGTYHVFVRRLIMFHKILIYFDKNVFSRLTMCKDTGLAWGKPSSTVVKIHSTWLTFPAISLFLVTK